MKFETKSLSHFKNKVSLGYKLSKDEAHQAFYTYHK